MNERGSLWIRVRMTMSMLVLAGLFTVVIHRAYRLQAVEGPRLREMAEQQYLKEIELPPRRGTIYDRHGSPLAVSVEVDSVYGNPRLVRERAAEVARRLSEVLGLDAWSLQRQLSGRRYFTWIKRRISPQQARQVRALAIPGIGLTKESRRFYPLGPLGSNIIGFAGLDSRGLEGVEREFDEALRGNAVRIMGLRDALGRYVASEGTPQVSSRTHDLRLTIDKFIQFETQKALAEAYPDVRPQTGWVAALVLDVESGDILALANLPSFDPNHYQKAKPGQWRNRVVADAFEPGSTIKVFTVAAALEAGLVRPGEVFDCEKGRWRVGYHTIRDAHPHARLDVAGILQKSSNIGAAKIGFRLGKARLHHELRRFGFGQPTGVDLPGERAGVLHSPRRWSDVALANVAFGQGMTGTILQLAQGLTALANQGVMVQPRIALELRDEHGARAREFRPTRKRVISRGTAARVLAMMRQVTAEGGTGVSAALERYTVAGKTGTAQKVDPVTGTYSKDRWVSSFVGVVPASRPRLVIVTVVNEPGGDKYYGGDVAAPIFKRIAEKALVYLGVKPDRAAGAPPVALAQRSPTTAAGYIEEESPPPLPGEGGPGGEILVPDFTGMSIAEARSAARAARVRLEIEGSGQAAAQSPGPGPGRERTVCRVSFRPPG